MCAFPYRLPPPGLSASPPGLTPNPQPCAQCQSWLLWGPGYLLIIFFFILLIRVSGDRIDGNQILFGMLSSFLYMGTFLPPKVCSAL